MIDEFEMPEDVSDIIEWHEDVADTQENMSKQMSDNGLEKMEREWKQSALAHRKCAKILREQVAVS